MRKLIISTGYPACVISLLAQNELIAKRNNAVPHELIKMGEIVPYTLELIINYPDDALSQALVFWFALAKGCGLVDHYRLVKDVKENPFGD